MFLGAYSAAGTDLVFAHYPNLLFGSDSLSSGHINFWNKYIFSGQDYTRSMHAHFLNPIFWPILAFKKKYMLHVLTWMLFTFNIVIGYVWCKISKYFGLTPRAALLVASVAQAGWFFWFCMTTLIAVPLFLYTSLIIYLVLTLHERSALNNIIFLSALFSLVLFITHPAYILGFMLPVFIISIFTIVSVDKSNRAKVFFILSSASLIALSMTAFRTVPVLLDIFNETMMIKSSNLWNQSHPRSIYLLLTALNPFSVGLDIGDSLNISTVLYNSAQHIQMHTSLFYGIVPFSVCYLAIRSGAPSSVILLSATYIILAFSAVSIEPFATLVNMMHIHRAVIRCAEPFALYFYLIFSLRHLSTTDISSLKQPIKEMVIWIGIILIIALTMIFCVLNELPKSEISGLFNHLKALRFLSILGIMLLAILLYKNSDKFFKIESKGPAAVAVVGLLLSIGLLAISSFIGYPRIHSNAAQAVQSVIFISVACLALLNSADKTLNKSILIMITLFLLFFSWPSRSVPHSLQLTLLTNIEGWIAFTVISTSIIYVFYRYASRESSWNRLLLLLLALSLIELVPTYITYMRSNTYGRPFHKDITDLYPNTGLQTKYEQYLNEGLKNSSIHKLDILALSVDNKNGEWKVTPNIKRCESRFIDNIPTACFSSAVPGLADNVYYDFVLKPKYYESVTFGVWVKNIDPNSQTQIFLNTRQHASKSSYISGATEWTWMTSNINLTQQSKIIRIHLNMVGKVEYFSPQLVTGSHFIPATLPGDEPSFIPRAFPEKIDLQNYRLNRVSQINLIAGNEIMANYAINDRTPTYAGVDSYMSDNYVQFLTAFEGVGNPKFHRAGMLADLDSPRMLDLLGVRYDLGKNEQVIVRENALPRMAAFHGYEIKTEEAKILDRLKSNSFNPQTTLIFTGASDQQIHTSQMFEKLEFYERGFDNISISISENTPRYILFNDRYIEGWEVSFNEAPLELLHANSIMMGVMLPEGAGELKFKFVPQPFFTILPYSLIVAAIFFLLALFQLFLSVRDWLVKTTTKVS